VSINEIRLPATMIHDLYKNSLVEVNGEKAVIEATALVPAKFLGGNERNILILAKSSDAVIVNDRQLSFLTKLLEACKMNIGDVAILNNAEEKWMIGELKKRFHPKSVLLFGCSPASIQLPIEFPMFKLQDYGGTIFLIAPTLEELDTESNEGKILKSKLWVCLKTLFGLR
jgi:hypothetical protein